MNERNVKDMNDQDLVNALRAHAEWAEANEWETPITLGDDLAEAADRIANQSTHIVALQQEIEKLRGQNEQLWEAAALVAKESAELLDNMPTVDAVPVVHGRWIPFHSKISGDIQYCSAYEIGFVAKSDYCPHCGAMMDGGEE